MIAWIAPIAGIVFFALRGITVLPAVIRAERARGKSDRFAVLSGVLFDIVFLVYVAVLTQWSVIGGWLWWPVLGLCAVSLAGAAARWQVLPAVRADRTLWRRIRVTAPAILIFGAIIVYLLG